MAHLRRSRQRNPRPSSSTGTRQTTRNRRRKLGTESPRACWGGGKKGSGKPAGKQVVGCATCSGTLVPVDQCGRTTARAPAGRVVPHFVAARAWAATELLGPWSTASGRHNTATLVHQTGRSRIGQSAAGPGPDPRATRIQRIEVLRDGASAQYGSDAIAGVVNIILKNDTQGGAALTMGSTRRQWRLAGPLADRQRLRDSGRTAAISTCRAKACCRTIRWSTAARSPASLLPHRRRPQCRSGPHPRQIWPAAGDRRQCQL
ncbi:TonB-dependent receptor plug domain-containing protein [Sphingobium yanoikuyae]|uniref:TonB-dependent receptor plug domain-containing protein n=1 Tax=Sphingobium yanoikuyae TaxID=13690 RepID=UPI00345E8BFB